MLNLPVQSDVQFKRGWENPKTLSNSIYSAASASLNLKQFNLKPSRGAAAKNSSRWGRNGLAVVEKEQYKIKSKITALVLILVITRAYLEEESNDLHRIGCVNLIKPVRANQKV